MEGGGASQHQGQYPGFPGCTQAGWNNPVPSQVMSYHMPTYAMNVKYVNNKCCIIMLS